MSALVKYNKQQVDSLRGLALIAAKSGNYQGMSEATLLNLMLSAYDFGISPMKAINGGFHVIKGKITMAAHLISDRIRSAGHSIKVVEHTREKCVAIGVRRDNGDSYRSEFDMEDAKAAGLAGSEGWRKYPKDMLYARCIARLGRVLFSDVVGSCYSEDEGFDIEGVAMDKRPVKDPDQDLAVEAPVVVETSEAPPPAHAMKALSLELEAAGIPLDNFSEFMSGLAKKKNETTEALAARALDPVILPAFKEYYLKKLAETASSSTPHRAEA